MKRARILRNLLSAALLLAIVAFGARVSGQTPPLDRAAIFKDTQSYLDYGWYNHAVVELKRVAEAYRGTEIEAIARQRMIGAIRRDFQIETLAQKPDKKTIVPLDAATRAQIVEQLDRLEAGFPNSQYDLWAKLERIDLENPDPAVADRMAVVLIGARTGVDIVDVLKGRRVRVSGIPLGGYYDYLSEVLQGSGQYTLEHQPGQFPQGNLNLVRFLRESFPFSTTVSSVGDYCQQLQEGPPTVPGLESIPPQVRVVSPRPSQTRSTRPRFRIETVVGDFRYGQVDLARLELTVDGIDLKPHLRVTTRLKRHPKLNKPIERLRLEGRLPTNLAPGEHKVHLLVPAEGFSAPGGVVAATTLDWTFRVQSQHDPDDEREGWCEEGWDDDP